MPTLSIDTIAPFALTPALLSKPWGGSHLPSILGVATDQSRIGEAWLCADLEETSVGGAGGGAVVSEIAEGWGKGLTLHDVVRRYPRELLGRPSARFPLLLKLLDAARPLSVQVHPSPRYAASHPGAKEKSESWWVLRTDAGARIWAGIATPSRTLDLAAAATSGEIIDLLTSCSVAAGDAITLPTGIIHALGGGITAFEVQTASDTTYRLYDWAKEYPGPARELHIEQAMAAADLAARPSIVRGQGAPGSVLGETAAYVLRGLPPGRSAVADVAARGKDGRSGCVLVFLLRGQGRLEGTFGSVSLATARVTVIPAALVDGTTFQIEPGAVGVVVAAR